ncbi:MAG: exodeoxyribonuclease V subunit gamma [Rudaea sp.]|nr:exodeoxyribonuclease V subunit gamma [Rudaea sp.]
MIPDDVGLIVHRGSRTERLAEKLAMHLEIARPPNPLRAQTVVVAHPGLRRWLLGEFARRPGVHGGHGIAANFDMILPWQWLERVARVVLGDAAFVGGPYRSEFLRWHIFRALPGLESAQIAAYLAAGNGEQRRFQLSAHLAGIFTQYLIYRPEWILAWERGPARDDDWQAALWRQLRSAIGTPHRAQRRDALLHALESRGDGETLPLHVFGVSHLPPDILAVMRALATRRCVHLYFPDPCREYWSDLRSRRQLLKIQADPQVLYYEIGHPLLVSLGRMAQDFCIVLDEADAAIERDELDEAEPLAGGESLLANLQSSIRCCQPDLVGAAVRKNVEKEKKYQESLLALRGDASLRVHACHTRLRELEATKDALLRALADDASLQHRDIVVMAPDIAAYAPYLQAVFGAAARYDADPAHIPWHLADVGLARAHPLMNAFQRMLDLAESRFGASEVMDFLDVPAVARRFGIDAGSREPLDRSVRRARVAWGLDADMKAQAGAAPIDANSWQFGFDRMYAGLLLGQDTPTAGFDGILPLQGVSGTATEAIGQLDHLLGELRRARAGFATSRSLRQWSEWLLNLIDAMFQADLRDDDEQSALDSLRRLVADLAVQADAAGQGTLLPWSVVRDVLRGALDNVAERQPFLLGGVTFCGLVPQRSIPFRVVCLIGMNEGEFPRATGDAGLNRMLTKPQRGDRDSRSEDRYLFLEALMSARDRLHISYVAEGVHDAKPRNPASPLAELLQFLDEQHGLQADNAAPRPWLLLHPLQPFDARYYRRDNDIADDGIARNDPRLFTYVRTFAHANTENRQRQVNFLAPGDVVAGQGAGGEVSLLAIKQYWRDPARDVLLRGAGLSLDALDDDRWSDREPLEAKPDRRERIDRRLLSDALAAGASSLPPTPPDWLALSGALASGAVGDMAYAQVRENAIAVLGPARDVLGARPLREPQAVDLDLGQGLRLTGIIERVFRTADGSRWLFDAKPAGSAGFRELLPFFIDLAALRLAFGASVQAYFVEKAKKPGQTAVPPELLEPMLAQNAEQLREGLRSLIRAGQAARAQPALYFPQTAWAWAAADPDKRDAAARNAWHGDGFAKTGERDYAPGYAGLLARDLDFLDRDSPARVAFLAATELVAGVLDPQRRVLLRESETGGTAAPWRTSRKATP